MKKQLKIYYDGACPLCSREIEHYKKQDSHNRLKLIDISDPHFDAEKEGVDSQRVHQLMHVRKPDQELSTGIDAFLAIWRELPGYGWLIHLVGNPLLKPFFDLGYHGFARIRSFLPKRRRDSCTTDKCYLGN
jgi:predicted DCC family thiol-disulfide oxidoreductase YuxK